MGHAAKYLINRMCRKSTTNRPPSPLLPPLLCHLPPFLSIPLPACCTDRATATMGVSWQTPDQKAFIELHLPSYAKHSESSTVKTAFWPEFFEKWFKNWPIPEPSPDVVPEGGSVQQVVKADRKKKIEASTIHLPTNRPELTTCTATEAYLQSVDGHQYSWGPTESSPRRSCSSEAVRSPDIHDPLLRHANLTRCRQAMGRHRPHEHGFWSFGGPRGTGRPRR